MMILFIFYYDFAIFPSKFCGKLFTGERERESEWNMLHIYFLRSKIMGITQHVSKNKSDWETKTKSDSCQTKTNVIESTTHLSNVGEEKFPSNLT